MEVNGRCLACDCEEFRRASETPESHEQMLERARAALARVERLEETAVALRAAQHPAGNGRRSWPG
jgi:ferric-dicitrate binding protein FerR (iron transport regulator)